MKEGSLMMLYPTSLFFLLLNEISLSVQLFSLKPGRKYLGLFLIFVTFGPNIFRSSKKDSVFIKDFLEKPSP